MVSWPMGTPKPSRINFGVESTNNYSCVLETPVSQWHTIVFAQRPQNWISWSVPVMLELWNLSDQRDKFNSLFNRLGHLLRSWTNTYQHPLWWLCITFHGVYRPRSRTQATQVSTLMETKCEQGHFKGAPHCHKQSNIHYAMSSLKMGSHQSPQTVQIWSSWLWAVWGVKFGDAGSIHNDSYCHVSTTVSGKQIVSPVKFHNSIDHLAKARRSVRRL